MSHVDSNSAIIATPVPEQERLCALPRYFGPWDVIVEGSVYNWMRELCQDYAGGEWRFMALSNGGLFLVPRAGQYTLTQPNNGFNGTVSAEAAGLIVTLYALSHLSFRYPTEEILTARFYQVRAFALDHTEATMIFRAIN